MGKRASTDMARQNSNQLAGYANLDRTIFIRVQALCIRGVRRQYGNYYL